MDTTFLDENNQPLEVSNANPMPVQSSLLGRVVSSSVTFLAGSTGSVNPHNLFTVTGLVKARFFAVCSKDVAGAGTIEVGTAKSTAGLIAQTVGTTIDNGEVWTAAAPATDFVAVSGLAEYLLNSTTVIYTVGTDTLTDGTITFYCVWVPVNSTGKVVAA